jgi:transposase
MEGFTKEVLPIVRDLLASPPAMDSRRGLGKSLDAAAQQAHAHGSNRLGRIDCRWHVRPCKKRGECVDLTKRGKGSKVMVLSDGHGLPLAIDVASARPHEVTLIEPLIERCPLRRNIRRLIYDRAADSEPLRARLLSRGIELICPNRWYKRRKTQDLRKLRRHSRRWKIERTISWLRHFRRLVTRYELHASMFLGFNQLACLMIVLRRF